MAVRQSQRVGYLEIVTDVFAEVRGSGVLLSPVDVEQVRAWEAAGVPVEVVCRGLVQGAEAYLEAHPGLRPPRHLAYYAGAVADALKAAREKAVGRTDG